MNSLDSKVMIGTKLKNFQGIILGISKIIDVSLPATAANITVCFGFHIHLSLRPILMNMISHENLWQKRALGIKD